MKKYNLIVFILISSFFASCNDDFLEKYPVTDLTEENAFLAYDNFKAFMYPCYDLFTNTAIQTNFNGNHNNSQFWGDFNAGILTSRDNSKNPWAYQTSSPTTSGGGWDFSSIRRCNIMLSHLGDGHLTTAEAAHWRSVAYFFTSWWYMELVNRFGDVPWINTVINESSPETYGARTPRAEVADSIIARLEYAAANIGTFKDGDNTITADAVKAALSRFLLREGTWAKYHGLNEPYQQYLEKCLTISQELMGKYGTLYKGDGKEKSPATGYGELWTTEDLSTVPGVIFFKQYYDGVLMHRGNDFEHISAHAVDVPQHTADMFLMKNGYPIHNPKSGYQGGKGQDLWGEFADRDGRMYQNIQPPYVVYDQGSSSPDYVNTFPTWRYAKEGDVIRTHTVTAEDAAKYRTYLDIMGINSKCVRGGTYGGEGMKRCPGQNWGAALTPVSPNLTTNSVKAYMRCWTGYYFWKNYDLWEFATGQSAFCTSDKPIFKVEEVLLNYAEASWELGKFDQSVCDRTINLLRDRSGVSRMNVSEITSDFDPDRDKGNAPWWTGKGGKFGNYAVDPVLWEIRRERQTELFGEGFGFYDVRRWAKAAYYINRQPCGMYITNKNIYCNNGSSYTGTYADYEAIRTTGKSASLPNSTGGDWIYTYDSPLESKSANAANAGWLDTYYLYMVPTNEIVLNPNLVQNPGYNELYGLK